MMARLAWWLFFKAWGAGCCKTCRHAGVACLKHQRQWRAAR